jgi:hypothetical protein
LPDAAPYTGFNGLIESSGAIQGLVFYGKYDIDENWGGTCDSKYVVLWVSDLDNPAVKVWAEGFALSLYYDSNGNPLPIKTGYNAYELVVVNDWEYYYKPVA